MIEYTLPSGKAKVKMTSRGMFAEKEFTYPLSKKDIAATLREALIELAKLTND